MTFRDRAHAAQLLATRLQRYKGQRPVVLGIPRGGLPMARAIADALGGDVDAVFVHKVGHPTQPEVAVGAVDDEGHVALTESSSRSGVPQTALDAEVLRQQMQLATRARRLRGVRAPCDLRDRLAVVVDDGVATGSTMEAAIRSVRRRGPSRVIAAMAVAPPSVVDRLRVVADEVICLLTPAYFFAVGGFFEDFSEVSDEEAARALEASTRPESPSSTVERGDPKIS